MANANVPLAGYETVFGNKKAMVVDHYGPASYVTGGETFSAHQLGWGGIDFIEPGNKGVITIGPIVVASVSLSFSHTYFVTVDFATTAVGSVASVTIKWYQSANGQEVTAATNLSAEKIRLFVLGV